MTELHGVLDQPIDTLSKGYRRRVGLAQAIVHDPDVLVMDEPTDGLDPNQKFQVRGAPLPIWRAIRRLLFPPIFSKKSMRFAARQ